MDKVQFWSSFYVESIGQGGVLTDKGGGRGGSGGNGGSGGGINEPNGGLLGGSATQLTQSGSWRIWIWKCGWIRFTR